MYFQSTVIALFFLKLQAVPNSEIPANDEVTELYPVFMPMAIDRFDYAVPQGANGDKFYNDEYEKIIGAIEIRLEQVLESMSGYIVEEKFNYVAFGPNVKKLRRYIFNIHHAIETRLGYDRRIERKAILCRKVFQLMVDSMEKMKRYSRGNITGHQEILGITSLRVWAALLTLNKVFDDNLDGYSQEVLRLYCMIGGLEISLWRRTDVPPGMLSLFENSAMRVTQILSSSMKRAGYEPRNQELCLKNRAS